MGKYYTLESAQIRSMTKHKKIASINVANTSPNFSLFFPFLTRKLGKEL